MVGQTPEVRAAMYTLLGGAMPQDGVLVPPWQQAGQSATEILSAELQGGIIQVQSAAAQLDAAAVPPGGNTGPWATAGGSYGQAYSSALGGQTGAAQTAGQSVGAAGVTGVTGEQ